MVCVFILTEALDNASTGIGGEPKLPDELRKVLPSLAQFKLVRSCSEDVPNTSCTQDCPGICLLGPWLVT